MKPSERDYFLGIESSTRTVVLLADPEGFTVGRGTGGASAYSLVGRDQCSQVLFQAILGAFSSAGFKVRDILAAEGSLPLVKTVCVGMRGVERPKDEAAVRRILTEMNLGDEAKTLVTSEARIVLESGLPDGIGIAALSGETGLIFGQGPELKTSRADGWGYLLGDVGSSHQLGLEAVKAVLRAADGREPTLLTELVEREWKLTAGRADLVARHVYGLLNGLGTGGNKALVEQTTETYRQGLAALAPLVERAAAKEDKVAQKILDACADEMAGFAQAVIAKTGLDSWTKPTKVVLAGSVLLSNQGELKRRFLERMPDLDEPVAVLEAAEGALKLAIKA